MKSAIVLLTILFSTNTFALSTVYGTSFVSLLLSGAEIRKEVVVKDASEYYQTGTLSPELAQEVNALQSHMELSDAEAVDLLVEYAEAELN